MGMFALDVGTRGCTGGDMCLHLLTVVVPNLFGPVRTPRRRPKTESAQEFGARARSKHDSDERDPKPKAPRNSGRELGASMSVARAACATRPSARARAHPGTLKNNT